MTTVTVSPKFQVVIPKQVREALGIKAGGNVEAAKSVGKAIAERAQKAGISTVVFDRAGYRYHGCVKALADAAREQGLKF